MSMLTGMRETRLTTLVLDVCAAEAFRCDSLVLTKRGDDRGYKPQWPSIAAATAQATESYLPHTFVKTFHQEVFAPHSAHERGVRGCRGCLCPVSATHRSDPEVCSSTQFFCR